MESNTLTSATKQIRISNLFDKIHPSAAFSETDPSQHRGAGSSFVSVPVKRGLTSPSATRTKNGPTFDIATALKTYINELVRESNANGQFDMSSGASDLVWTQLRVLRSHAASPERTDKGVEKLMTYYAQLCWMEEKFCFETNNELEVKLIWYEAFQPKRKQESSSLQFEKACVVWNIGSLYSQLGSSQSLWNGDGLRLAAQCFQKAAGAFRYIRDSLCPRLDDQAAPSSDFEATTLSALSELMLAQASECFYLKAEYDNTSSPVTSQIAAQTSDYYDIAYRASKSGGLFFRNRLPKAWITHIQVKHLMFVSFSHLHCPNTSSPQYVVGERQARLGLALEFAVKALEKCTVVDVSASPELRVAANSAVERIRSALADVDKANFEEFHQTVAKKSSLRPVRRPPYSLVHVIDIVEGVDAGSVKDLVAAGVILDLFASLGSGTHTAIPIFKRYSIDYPYAAAEVSRLNESRSSGPIGMGDKAGEGKDSMASLAARMHHQFPRRFTENDIMEQNGNAAPYMIEKAKQASREFDSLLERASAVLQRFTTVSKNWDKSTVAALHSQYRQKVEGLEQISGTAYADSMLLLYRQSAAKNSRKTTGAIVGELKRASQDLTVALNEVLRNVMDAEASRKQIHSNHAGIQELLRKRKMFDEAERYWRGVSNEVRESNILISASGVEEFIAEVEREGYEDLFGDPNGQDDLKWTEQKVKTVIPCLQDFWSERFRRITSFSAEASDGSISADSNINHIVKVTSDFFLWVCQEVQNCVSEVSSIVADLKHVSRKLVSSNKPDAVVKALTEMSNSPEHHSPTQKLNQGIDTLNGVVLDAEKRLEGLMHNTVVRKCLGVHPILTMSKYEEFLDMCAGLLREEEQSDKIVSVFNEQLEKWNRWHTDAVEIQHKISSSLQWVREQGATEALSVPVAPPRRKSVNSKQRSSVVLADLIQKQNALQEEQVRTAWEMADKTIDQVDEYSKSYANKFANGDSGSLASDKTQAMRKLSIAASAINRTANMLDAEVDEADHGSKMAAITQKRAELFKQLHSLSKYQTEFSRIHNEQIESLGRVSNERRPVNTENKGRRKSILEAAKSKFTSLLQRRKSTTGNSETLVINQPKYINEERVKERRRESLPEFIMRRSNGFAVTDDYSTRGHIQPPPFAPSAPSEAELSAGGENNREKRIRRKPVIGVNDGLLLPYGNETRMYHAEARRKSTMGTQKEQPGNVEDQLSQHLPPLSRKSKGHFIDNPHTNAEFNFSLYNLDDSRKLRSGMDSVAKYFAYNRGQHAESAGTTLGGAKVIP